jgi:transposase InsO family protein
MDDEWGCIIFENRKSKAGARTIKMLLQKYFWISMNLKKVRRIMKKHGLHTIIRRKNKYKHGWILGEEHRVSPNILDRNFDVGTKDTVYSTDITYLDYGNGKRAYLSAVKDLATKEIVHHTVSPGINLNIATQGLEDLFRQKPKHIIMHSDQGCHYTSKSYRELLSKWEVTQSMSRKGNCLDNAPIESFFGHLKDEAEFRSCHNYEELVAEINRYINYYNTERPQSGLKGKTPTECRGFT